MNRIARASTSLVAGVLLTHLGNALAQETTSSPNLTGLWELNDKSRHITPAKLAAGGEAHTAHLASEAAKGNSVVYASRWCNYMGVPFIMGQSPPIDIVQDRAEVGIFSEQNSAARHIYLDGRTHPSADAFVPATNGHSVGHWEGDTLVVDTTNFSFAGLPTIPGGGYRRPGSHLVERFQLTNAGNDLSVSSTWTDPYVFVEPHTYEFVFHRAKAGSYVFEDSCDASDAAPFVRAGGVAAPPSD